MEGPSKETHQPGLWNLCGGFGVEPISGFNRFGVAVPPAKAYP